MEKNKLDEIRLEIDSLDRNLTRLIEKRMELVSRVAEYKSKNKTEVLDEEREKKVIDNALSVVDNPEYSDTIKATFESIMAHSREYQKKRILNSQAFKRYVLIGEHLSHSMSVPIHNLFFKKTNITGSYELLEVPRDALAGILRKLKAEGCYGVNVTIPYKTELMSALDSLSDEVLKVGAVNTIKMDGEFIGYNTDYRGFGMALSYNGINPKDKTCAVLGSGGASRAVVTYLKNHGAASISIVTRDTNAACMKYPGLHCIPIDQFISQGFDLIINTTPVGMIPNAGYSPITKSQLKGACFVMDLIYNPSETLLMLYAKELGIPCTNGLYMLVAQAICAQEIWQAKTFDQELVNAIYEEMRSQ